MDERLLTKDEVDLVQLIGDGLKWFAVYTRPFHERNVHDILRKKGIEVFLPTRLHLNYRRKLIEVPLFRSYLFVHVEPKAPFFYQVLDTPGVVKILSYRGIPLPADDEEIESLKILVANAKDELLPYPSMKKGDCVVIIDGPLKGARGYIDSVDAEKLEFVVNITLLGRSVAVKVDPAVVRRC